MRRCCFIKPAVPRTAALLFALCAISLSAQTALDSRAQHPSALGYDKAHEITLNGTIQEVVSRHVPGSPVGLHLLVAGHKGTVDAHLGPYLTKDTQEALRAGTLVQITGAMATLHGREYLLAREVTAAGGTVTVRSKNGFLIRSRSAARPATETSSKSELNGGAR